MSATAIGPNRSALLTGAAALRQVQPLAMQQSRLKIPLLLGINVMITGSATTMESAASLLTRVTVS